MTNIFDFMIFEMFSDKIRAALEQNMISAKSMVPDPKSKLMPRNSWAFKRDENSEMNRKGSANVPFSIESHVRFLND